MTVSDRWPKFLEQLNAFAELTVVGPLAAARGQWPEPCVFVDGGARHQGPSPLHISVGDGDSHERTVDHLLPTEKDYSDLAFVLAAVPPSIKRLAMVGFLGGRRDHELINWGEVHRFLNTRTQPTACDLDSEVYAYGRGDWRINLQGVFSLVAFESVSVLLQGACRYQLTRPTLLEPVSSHGLSNEADGEVHLKCDGPVFIFTNLLL